MLRPLRVRSPSEATKREYSFVAIAVSSVFFCFTIWGVFFCGALRSACPYSPSEAVKSGAPSDLLTRTSPSARKLYGRASIPKGGFSAVRKDLNRLFTDSQPFWPADFGTYAPFMVRLAWHCAGSYRASDGRGGCDGARIRHMGERAWPDNTNLDKALRLLQPVKDKYGETLSWGDLIALAGDTAITSMGGPSIGFCGGRLDDADGSASLTLGPSKEQKAVASCPVNGKCKFPLGPTTVGLIYVNAAGPMENNSPTGSVVDIRSSFGNMGMNDIETVALVGGGHAFGKVHGACKTGPGPGPKNQPNDPYPGTCGTPGSPNFGKGNNTYTSGFEGAWTTRPTMWTNEYFTSLLKYKWVEVMGPGGKIQWRPEGVPNEDGGNVRMLTTDIALLKDDNYLEIVKQFAANITSLEHYFAEAWYKLVTRDMGPVTRCIGDEIPEARSFQRPLPPAGEPHSGTLLSRISVDLKSILHKSNADLSSDTVDRHKSYNGALLVNLAYQCASTFRATDYRGGCNGAMIRFSPEKDFPENKGTEDAIKLLSTIRDKYKRKVSISDLIVLAGNVALEEAGGLKLVFCQGRVDAVSSTYLQWEQRTLAPRTYIPDPILSVRDNQNVMGHNAYDTVALAGRLRSPRQQQRLGFRGSYSNDPSHFSNSFFKILLEETWAPVLKGAEFDLKTEYKANGKNIFITGADLVLVKDQEYRTIVEEFSQNERTFKEKFAESWTKLMNADRFDGPDGNVCD